MSTRDTARVLYFGAWSTLAGGTAPPVAPADAAGIYYESDSNELLFSENAGAWVPIGSVIGAGGWNDDGTVVRLTTATDVVRIGGIAQPVGTKLSIVAEQAITGGVDTTQGIDVSITRSAALPAGDFVTCVAFHPGGNAGDNAASFVTGLFVDAPIGPAAKDAIFILGNPAGASFWTNAINVNDNDCVIVNTRQTAGAPADIVLRSNVGALPTGKIRAETVVGGVTTVHWEVSDALGFTASVALRVGGDPAAAGQIRLTGQTSIATKQGGFQIPIIGTDVGINVVLGSAAANDFVDGATSVITRLATVTKWQVLTNGCVVGAAALDGSAVLDVQSTTRGVLFPRMTGAQRDAIAGPTSGLVIYNTDTGKLNLRGAAAWETVTSA